MKELVMCAAYGYDVEGLKPFAHSLRKYYDGDVIFVIKELTHELQEFFIQYKISFYISPTLNQNNDIQWIRYSIFHNILSDLDVDQIFISDVRDVVFQDSPFVYRDTKFDLEFFEEPERIRNCRCNAGWIMSLYGVSALTNIGDNNIICSGTTLGSKSGMLKYFESMMKEISSFMNRRIQIKGGEDQPIHNHLIRNGKIDNYIVHANCLNAVATLDHQKNFMFDENGKLINIQNSIIPVVHQWDRKKEYSDQFFRIAME